jgi:hypothetical protein
MPDVSYVIRCRQSIKVNNDKLSGFTAKPMLMSSNKLLKRKRKISFAIFYNRQYLSFISSCSSSRSRLCIKCSWTTDLNSFQVKERRSRTRHSTLQKLKPKLKYLDLQKLIRDFRNSFNTYRRGF